MVASRTYAVLWIVVFALLGFAGWLFERGMAGVSAVTMPRMIGAAVVGSVLPDAPVIGLNEQKTSLRAFAGHPLWINFFATWCEPCKAEIPEIERRYESDRSQRLVVLGIDQDEERSQVDAFMRRFGATYAIAIDRGAASAAFGVQAIPVSIFVDARGIVRSIRIGQMRAPAMDEALATIGVERSR